MSPTVTAADVAARVGLGESSLFEIRIIDQYQQGDYLVIVYEIICKGGQGHSSSLGLLQQLGYNSLKYVMPVSEQGGEYSKLPDGGALETQEGVVYGTADRGKSPLITHSVGKHVEKSRGFLEHRLVSERKTRVSTFLTMRDANLYIARTLEAKQPEINAWLSSMNRRRREEFSLTFPGEVVGAVLEAVSGELIIGHTCRVVLGDTQAPSGLGFTVVTAMVGR